MEKVRILKSSLILLFIVFFLCPVNAASPSDWTYRVLSTNSYTDDARIAGDKVMWVEWDGSDNEVFLYDDATETTTQVTNNAFNEYDIELSETHAVWRANNEIYYYDFSTVTQVTNNGFDDSYPGHLRFACRMAAPSMLPK